jgi:proteic killer suppression protein
MELYFHDPSYDRLEADREYLHGFPVSVVSQYRKRLQLFRAARDERDLAAMRCLRFSQLEARSGRKYSVHLNNHYRLIIELRPRSDRRVLWVVEVQMSQS